MTAGERPRLSAIVDAGRELSQKPYLADKHCDFRAASELVCWCGSGTWRLYLRGRRFSVLKCSGCLGYRIDPPPISSPQESEDFYTNYYRTVATEVAAIEKSTSSKTAGFWRVAERAPDLLQVRRTVLDIGCGDGHLCAELKASGWPSVIGIDVSRTRVARARQLYPDLTFFDRPLTAIGLEKSSLNLIVMEAVIEHLPQPIETLAEFRDFLAPGGQIVLTTPNMDSGEFRFLRKRWTSMLAPHAHIFLFSPASIRALLSQAGFTPETTGSYTTPLYTPLDYLKRLGRGDLKGTIWRVHQDLGVVYGRLLQSSSMLFAVGRKQQ
jgi:2-polyprenyl-3-methyl-5-hydroxy-6-metoxy-1,4-benzoquinol methylase